MDAQHFDLTGYRAGIRRARRRKRMVRRVSERAYTSNLEQRHAQASAERDTAWMREFPVEVFN